MRAMPASPASSPTAYERYRPWQRLVETGFWVGTILVNAVANSITVLMDARRSGLDTADWEPAVWEGSSALLWLVIVPCVVWFTRRVPFQWDGLRRYLALHLAASVLVCLVHVGGMVGLRVLAYRVMGGTYVFGDWPVELGYEYLKDVRSYAGMVLAIEVYRLALRRLQGEASLLAAPDEGPPLESVERPERFLVRKLGRDFLVAANDIEWLQAAGNYVNLRVRGHDYPLRSTIAGIEARLDPARFARVHRSYIVNLDRIVSIEPLDTGDARLHLADGSTLPCSRRYRADLKERV
ncbi:AlgR/AgrA/LytR family regulatory protein RpfD [Dokdonella koreensis DS-123]|uniref:AlgR/AgrA/LytR family regulatory protein RpfD n=2 Tax=Dokdonella TaxID=323413 RepID=A0A160DZ94_9GAMM|nr:AlgR/AgrA/LytR family regulatory protein RpfD [Dokdonella koreensis DS-123]